MFLVISYHHIDGHPTTWTLACKMFTLLAHKMNLTDKWHWIQTDKWPVCCAGMLQRYQHQSKFSSMELTNLIKLKTGKKTLRNCTDATVMTTNVVLALFVKLKKKLISDLELDKYQKITEMQCCESETWACKASISSFCCRICFLVASNSLTLCCRAWIWLSLFANTSSDSNSWAIRLSSRWS